MKRLPVFAWFVCVAVGLSPMGLLAQYVEVTNPPPQVPNGFHQKVPWAVACSMKGTVTNVVMVDGRIQFKLTGWFWFSQYPEGGTNQQIVRFNCQNGMTAVVTPDSFVAMTPNWTGGSVQNDKGRLLEILEVAEKRGNVVKFSLSVLKIDFGGGTNAFLDAHVWNITDADLH
jgi:hypothetical protein